MGGAGWVPAKWQKFPSNSGERCSVQTVKGNTRRKADDHWRDGANGGICKSGGNSGSGKKFQEGTARGGTEIPAARPVPRIS